MTVADRDLDEFIAEHLPADVRPDGRVGTILGLDDERDPGSGHVVLLEHVGRAYTLTASEFILIDQTWNA